MVSAGAQKCPGQSHQTFSGVITRTCSVAGGNGDQLGVERVGNNLAGVEFEGVLVWRLGQYYAGFERREPACRAVRDKMNEGKLLRMTGKISLGSCLVPHVGLTIGGRKVLLDFVNLDPGVGEVAK